MSVEQYMFQLVLQLLAHGTSPEFAHLKALADADGNADASSFFADLLANGAEQTRSDPIIYTAVAGLGGDATEAITGGDVRGAIPVTEVITVADLLATDTILSVTQMTPGANYTPFMGWTTQIDGSIKGIWSSDPGPGSVLLVCISR